jgi:hypothetical protein
MLRTLGSNPIIFDTHGSEKKVEKGEIATPTNPPVSFMGYFRKTAGYLRFFRVEKWHELY